MPSITKLLNDLNTPHQLNAPLAPLTRYKVGGSAQILAQPQSITQLLQITKHCHATKTPLYIIGNGSNLLITNTSDTPIIGLVIQLNSPAFQQIDINPNTAQATAAAGTQLANLITTTIKHNLIGLEPLAGIPATIGGAIKTNAGSKFGDIAATLHSLTLITPDNSTKTLTKPQLNFTYRCSNLPDDHIIISATFQLTSTNDPAALQKRFKQVIQHKRDTQPITKNSAGCVFKNPSTDITSKSAGQLIDEAGLKGHQIGNAQISTQHANFIITHPNATATDILNLITHTQNTVMNSFNIKLQPEIVIWSK